MLTPGDRWIDGRKLYPKRIGKASMSYEPYLDYNAKVVRVLKVMTHSEYDRWTP